MKKADLLFINIVLLAYIPFLVCGAFIPLMHYMIAFLILFVFPGYALLNSMVSYSNTLSVEEKIVYSTGVSTAIVVLTGLILNYSLGIGLLKQYIAISLFICAMSLITYIRRNKQSIPIKTCKKKDSSIKDYLILTLLSVPILIIYFNKGLTQEYIYRHWAFAELFNNQEHINPLINTGSNFYDFSFVSLYPGHDLFLISLVKFTGINGNILQFVPIMSVVLLFVFYSMLKQWTNSRLASLLIAYSTIILDLAYHLQLSIIWYYSLSILIFLSFIKFFSDYTQSRNPSLIILMLILFTASFFIHHRVPMWVILALVGFNLIQLSNYFTKEKNIKITCFYLLICFIVIYLGFNKVIYKNYLPIIARLSGIEGVDTLVYFIKDLFSMSHDQLDAYMYPPSPHVFFSRAYSAANVLKYFITIVPIIFFLPSSIKIFREHDRTNSLIYSKVLLLYTLLFILVAENIAYFILGRLSMVYYSIIMPILALMCINLLNFTDKAKFFIKVSFIISMMILSIIKFNEGHKVNYNMLQISYEEISSSSNWLKSNSSHDKAIMSDFRLWGMYLLDGIKDNYMPRYRYITSNLYESIVTGKNIEKNEILIIDRKDIDRPVVSMFWRYFKPLSLYYGEISNNKYLIKNYNDGKVEIYNTT
ncbi:MAG: DUF1616 domain-containing protein [Peptococcaceae bacterium]|nr:DUF1616 domain-containing protein [Peptococcaceae bacterium]